MKYFSLDYRSPPSGMGHVVDTEQPEMIGDKYNMILIDYGDNPQEDPHYVETKYFFSNASKIEPGEPPPPLPSFILLSASCWE